MIMSFKAIVECPTVMSGRQVVVDGFQQTHRKFRDDSNGDNSNDDDGDDDDGNEECTAFAMKSSMKRGGNNIPDPCEYLFINNSHCMRERE